MELEIIKKDGKTLLLVPDELIAKPSSQNSEAAMAEAIKPKDEEIVRLKEEVTRLSSPERGRELFAEVARNLDSESFVKMAESLAPGLKMTPEGFVELAEALGFDALIPEASAAELAEGEEAKVAETPLPATKPYEVFSDPGDSAYEHLPGLGIWILKEAPHAESAPITGAISGEVTGG